MRERIDLVAPLSGDFHAVVRLIIGGIAERVDFAFEVGADGIRTRVGPLSEHKVAEALRDGNALPGELTLRRILQTVVDSFGVDEADDGRIVVRLEKIKGIA